jgi:hypothetical protein
LSWLIFLETPNIACNRRRALARRGSPRTLSIKPDRSKAMTNVGQGRAEIPIRPFQVNTPEAELTELRRRINATRWPEKETVTVLRRQRRRDPDGRERFSRRALSGPAELGRAGVSQTHLLQPARQRRALCSLGAAETLFRRCSRGFQTAAEIEEGAQSIVANNRSQRSVADRPAAEPGLSFS